MSHLLLFAVSDFIMNAYTEHKTLIWFFIMAFAVGVVSQLILPGRGFGMIATIALGIAGSYLGNKFLMDHMTFIEDDVFRKVASALAGTMIISVVINLIRGAKDRDLTHWRHN